MSQSNTYDRNANLRCHPSTKLSILKANIKIEVLKILQISVASYDTQHKYCTDKSHGIRTNMVNTEVTRSNKNLYSFLRVPTQGYETP